MSTTTKNAVIAAIIVAVLPASIEASAASEIGTEEFGLTAKQLFQKIEKVEASVAACMRNEGFEYLSVDYQTVHRGMKADKVLPGLEEEQFLEKYGFGMSTLYTGQPPQLATGYSPAKIGLGRRNVQVFMNLSAADQVAYSRALFGSNADATFAAGLEAEDLSRTGGCTREAIEQVFDSHELKASYYNPKDALINKDPRMQAAIRKWTEEIREAGFDYNHPDEIELDVQRRLDVITENGSIALGKLPAAKLAALEELKDYERRVAVINFELEEELIEEVEERIERELFSRKVN